MAIDQRARFQALEPLAIKEQMERWVRAWMVVRYRGEGRRA